jgi:threonine dehydrogenase-like Zn-dependent dehydrogenase
VSCAVGGLQGWGLILEVRLNIFVFAMQILTVDIFPTGWHSTRLAELKPGESIVIYGAGPVGLMAAMSARIQGASQTFLSTGDLTA